MMLLLRRSGGSWLSAEEIENATTLRLLLLLLRLRSLSDSTFAVWFCPDIRLCPSASPSRVLFLDAICWLVSIRFVGIRYVEVGFALRIDGIKRLGIPNRPHQRFHTSI